MRKYGICYCYGMCALFQAILEITLLVLWIRLYKHFVINTGDFTFQPLEPLDPLDFVLKIPDSPDLPNQFNFHDCCILWIEWFFNLLEVVFDFNQNTFADISI